MRLPDLGRLLRRMAFVPRTSWEPLPPRSPSPAYRFLPFAPKGKPIDVSVFAGWQSPAVQEHAAGRVLVSRVPFSAVLQPPDDVAIATLGARIMRDSPLQAARGELSVHSATGLRVGGRVRLDVAGTYRPFARMFWNQAASDIEAVLLRYAPDGAVSAQVAVDVAALPRAEDARAFAGASLGAVARVPKLTGDALFAWMYPGWHVIDDNAAERVYANQELRAVIRVLKGAGYQHAPVRLFREGRTTEFFKSVPGAVAKARSDAGLDGVTVDAALGAVTSHRGVPLTCTAGVCRYTDPATGQRVAVGQAAGGRVEAERRIDAALQGRQRQAAGLDGVDTPAGWHRSSYGGYLQRSIYFSRSGRKLEEIATVFPVDGRFVVNVRLLLFDPSSGYQAYSGNTDSLRADGTVGGESAARTAYFATPEAAVAAIEAFWRRHGLA